MEKSSSKDVIQQDVKKIDNKALNNFRTSYEEILQQPAGCLHLLKEKISLNFLKSCLISAPVTLRKR